MLLSVAAARTADRGGPRAPPPRSGWERRCSSTCTWRRRSRTRVSAFAVALFSRSGCTSATGGPYAARSRSAQSRGARRHGPRAGRDPAPRGPLLDYAVALSRRIRRRGMHWGTEIALAAGGLVVVRRRLPAAAARVPGAERTDRAARRGHAEDDVDVAARPGGAVLAGARPARLDAAGSARHRRSLPAGTSIGRGRRGCGAARSPAPGDDRAAACGARPDLHLRCVESWTVAGAFGQRRFVAITPILIDRPRGAVAGRAVAAAAPPRGGCRRGCAIWWNLALDGALRHAD